MMRFQTIAPITLGWICFLTSESAPQTELRNLSRTAAFREWLGTKILFSVPPLISTILIIYGRTKPWSVALLALICAIAIDGFGNGMIVFLTAYNFPTAFDIDWQIGGSPGPTVFYWLYYCGRSFTCLGAITIATFMGIRISVGTPRTTCERTSDSTEVVATASLNG